MTSLLDGLFGVSGMSFADPGVDLGFARPIPAWGWLLALLLAAALAAYAYLRQDGPRPARIALGTLRALTLLALLLVLSGPQLVRTNERTEQDWVVVLADRSASMAIPDAPIPPTPPISTTPRTTRDAQLQAALDAAAPALQTLAQQRRVLWLGFDRGAFDLAATNTALPQLGPAAGRRTALGASLDQALARVAARPVSGIVILSDGRSVDEPSRPALQRLQAEQIPVLALPLGSPDPIPDLALTNATAPAVAFVNDTIPVAVEIDRTGPASAAIPTGRVQLIDTTTGAVLDQRPLPTDPAAWDNARARITLTTKPLREGQEPTGVASSRAWAVRLDLDQPDLLPDNNTTALAIELIDRQLRVAYFDGYPRWEHRFLKSLLLRERSIRSANLLLAPNRQYLQEGDEILDTLPRSSEDWARFDVIILGDLAASMFSREQLEQLRDHVSLRGAGLLWIAGPAATPGSWRDTPLADLLPFATAPEDWALRGGAGVESFAEPVLMRPTRAAQRLNLLQLADQPASDQLPTDQPLPGWPPALLDPRTGWSQLQWAQQLAPASLKPTAEVLAEFVPASFAADTAPPAWPAVITMRYGAGRVMYVATDEIWRWRYARGETLNERFWLPLIRLQGRDSLARAARPAALDVSPTRPQTEQPVAVAVRLLDQALVDAAPPRVAARVRPLDVAAARDATTVELSLAPEQLAATGRAITKSFLTTWTPLDPGRYRIEVTEPALAATALAADIEVTVPDDELLRPEADHAALASLTTQAGPGGRLITTAELAELDRLLPRREVVVAGIPEIQTLWDRPIVLIILLLLLALEWAGRRLIKLT